jgi:hypothetical protein
MANNVFSSIKTIMSVLKNSFNPPQQLQSIPKQQILIGSKFRSGLSAIEIASKIIDRKKEAGIPITPLPSGGENLDLIMETIRVEVMIEALLTKAKIEVAIPPGTQINAQGANAGGPIVVQGATITISKGEGIIR